MNDFPSFKDTEAQSIQSQPHNRQAEESVLGSVLINPESYYDIAQILKGINFYIIRNRWIWEVFNHLHNHRIPIDILTVSEELDKRNQLNEIGGQAYLLSLVNQTPSSLNVEAYAQIVDETSVRRQMLNAANEIAKLAYDQEKRVNSILDSAEKSIFNLSERRIRRDLQPIKSVLSEYYDRVSQLSQQKNEFFGVPTGLIDLDKVLGGMQKSDLLIIAGRPASGKTGFLLTVAKNAAQKHKKHVAFFSLEMSNEQLVQRLIAQETHLNTQRLRSGDLEDDEWPLFTHAIEVLSDTNIFLDDTPAITPIQMRTKCRRLHLEYHLDLILVDYIQLMSSDTRTENRVQEVSYISRNLKTLAKELNVPVLAAAQLSRAVEQRADKRPMLSDLRESGSLEQDSDIVMFIHRPEALKKESEKQNITKIIVAKHRNGPTHSGIEIVFLNDIARFENAATLPFNKSKKG
ncbi:MAG TPA: replicative DNA helicase [Anaerolineae bacterium]|nr:replicative DNA helicase [Anaerolineae bacterium]